MRLNPFALAPILLALSPAHAFAAVLLFNIEGLPGTGPAYTFSFQLDTATAPNNTTTETSRFNGTQITYTRPGSTMRLFETGTFDGPTFFATIQQGGVALLRLDREPDPLFRLFGPQLFTGSTSAPRFILGTFSLASTPRNGGDPVQPLTYRLTISDSVAVSAIPEPSTWVMMFGGFALLGAAIRRRRDEPRQATLALPLQ